MRRAPRSRAMRVCYYVEEDECGGGDGGGKKRVDGGGQGDSGLASLKSERLTAHCGKSWWLTKDDQMGQRARPAADVRPSYETHNPKVVGISLPRTHHFFSMTDSQVTDVHYLCTTQAMMSTFFQSCISVWFGRNVKHFPLLPEPVLPSIGISLLFEPPLSLLGLSSCDVGSGACIYRPI